ncbi:hypothetical protein [Actinoalloteichus hymeniacidonis]|uniref:hypothetical protein n=1 Tax=Actinoalloteichus hymeniacidonis TaxID=340345 RepID=UPI0012FA7F0D|nr:hypothetical protein [Actinoalloteichus hymeniacidonis]MBB5906948.1 hypothetical protein [Actinoalloteichus hymeniacidonis]
MTERLRTTAASFENRTAYELRNQLDAVGYGGDFGKAWREWVEVAYDFEYIGEYLDAAIKKAAAAHSGLAADASQNAVTPLAEFTRQAKEQALAIGSAVSGQGLSHKVVRRAAPLNPAPGPPAKEGFENVLPSSWTGHGDRVEHYEDENRAARSAMYAYQDASNEQLRSFPVFDPPPAVEYRVSEAVPTLPNADDEPSVQPSSVAGGVRSLPGDAGIPVSPSGIPAERAAGGGQPRFVSGGAGSSAGAGAFGRGRTHSDTGGNLAPRRTTGSASPTESGRPTGITPTGGGPAPTGGGMPAGRPTGNSGDGDGGGGMELEHERASYLVESEDLFGDGRQVAPPVVGG